jgi:hypothetical protein
LAAIGRPGQPHDSAAAGISNPIWYFNNCSENNPLVLFGQDNYYVSGDGFLMPVKKGQQPPDL